MDILTGETLYHPYQFTKEADFEARVIELADRIFGEQTIYLDIKKKLKASEFSIIPDGFLIDMTIPTSPKLYLIENEIVSHDPFKHIGIQLLKFSINFDGSQTQIRNILMKCILENSNMRERLNRGCQMSDARNIGAVAGFSDLTEGSYLTANKTCIHRDRIKFCVWVLSQYFFSIRRHGIFNGTTHRRDIIKKSFCEKGRTDKNTVYCVYCGLQYGFATKKEFGEKNEILEKGYWGTSCLLYAVYLDRLRWRTTERRRERYRRRRELFL